MVTLAPPSLTEDRLRKADFSPEASKWIERAIGSMEGHAGASLEAWNHALKMAPRHPVIFLGRGLTLLRLGRASEAIIDFDQAEQLGIPPAFEATLHEARAVALLDIDRSSEAIRELDLYLAQNAVPEVEKLRRQILDYSLKRLVADGFGSWSGKRPKGSKNPVPITSGPPVSDYVIEDRG